jgi:peptide/nickel transport system substrate-binding protein
MGVPFFRIKNLALAGAMLAASASMAGAQTLRIGLNEDPDILDPARARTFVGRIVFAALCDKLVDITRDLKFVPRLATEWSTSADGMALTFKLRPGVTFHDGEVFDAAAVKYNIERSKTLPDSFRKSELSSVASVAVVDPLTVTFNLSRPDATLVAQLSDRAGMMISPKAAEAGGQQFGLKPICSGPYKFVERVAQDRIVLERFANHWAKEAYSLERVTYTPIPDTTVRLANLRSNDLQLIERLAATDVKSVKADKTLRFDSDPGIGWQAIYINTNNGERAKTRLGQDKRIRQALELALDRNAINEVVFDGVNPPINQPFAPTGPWYAKEMPIKARDVAKAKELMKQSGVPLPLKVEVMMGIGPVEQQVAQLLQAMWAEIGVEITLKATEFATMIKETGQGMHQISVFGWSGRVDPDGNIHQFVTCKGSQNDGKYCNAEVDKALDEARSVGDLAQRKALYDKAQKILLEDLPVIYTYQQSWLYGVSAKVEGFKPYPDGMIRLDGVKLVK